MSNRWLECRLSVAMLIATITQGFLQAEVSFKPGAQEILLPLGQGEFQLAQLNADNHVDILVGLPGRINAYLNDGSGVYGGAVEVLKIEGDFEFAVFDIDSDGDTDLWISHADGLVSIWENREGTFQEQESPSISRGIVTLGDIDGDNDIDVIIAQNSLIAAPPNFPGVGHQVWLNEGQGKFAEGQFLATDFSEVGRGELGDLNGDNTNDFLAIYPGEGARVWLGDEAGRFSESDVWILEPTGGQFGGLALADFDDDNDLDVLLAHSGGQNHWWQNSGSGDFNTPSLTIGNYQPLNVVGDLDNDTDIDLLTAGLDCQDCTAVWLSHQGSLQASDIQIFTEDTSIHQLDLADVDEDGDLDVIALLDIIEAPAGRTVVSTWLNGLIDLSQEPSGLIGIKDLTLASVIRERLDLPPDLSVVPDYSQLTSLHINREDFGAAFDPIESLSGLEAADELELLELNGVLNLDASGGVLDLRFLEDWTRLKTLRLNSNGIKQLIFPTTWGTLRELSLNDNAIFDIGFINQLPALEALSLTSNQVTSFNLGQTPLTLKDLDLSGNPLAEIQIPDGLSELKPSRDELRNAGVLLLGDQQIKALFSPIGEARRFEFQGEPGVYLIRRSVNLVDWETIQELTIVESSPSPTIFADETGGLGSTIFYSVIPQSSP